MSGHSSRWSYQMGPLSEPHLQQAPLTSAARVTPGNMESEAHVAGEDGIGGYVRVRGTDREKKKTMRGVQDGRVWSVLDGCLQSPMNTRLPAGALISTVMILLLHGMFLWWADGSEHRRMHSHAFNTRQGPTHQWTQPDTPLSCLIRRL